MSQPNGEHNTMRFNQTAMECHMAQPNGGSCAQRQLNTTANVMKNVCCYPTASPPNGERIDMLHTQSECEEKALKHPPKRRAPRQDNEIQPNGDGVSLGSAKRRLMRPPAAQHLPNGHFMCPTATTPSGECNDNETRMRPMVTSRSS